MGNWEMGKWEEGTLHFTQTADVLLLQSSNVMRKSMSIHALIETSSLPDSWQGQCPSMPALIETSSSPDSWQGQCPSMPALIETSSSPDSWQGQCPSMHSLRHHLRLTVGKVNVHPCTH